MTFLDERFRAGSFVELAPGLVFGDIQRRYKFARVIGQSADQYYERDQLLPEPPSRGVRLRADLVAGCWGSWA